MLTNLFETLVNEALENGQTRLVCPACGGGNSKERCLSVWEADDRTVMLTCHRAHCDIGTRPFHTVTEVPTAKARTKFDTKQSDISTPLLEEDIEEFNGGQEFKYSRRALAYHVLRHPRGWLFPMQTRRGDIGGSVLRPREGDVKSLTFRYRSDWDGMGWYVGIPATARGYLYIVEDARSAIALWDIGLTAVTLNGTNLSAERWASIRDMGPRPVLALDADATEKSLAYRLRYGSSLLVRRLSRDVKNMSRQEVAMLVGS